MIALDSEGCMTHKVVDFFHWERVEMCSMSAPTEIAPNVWLGPTPDPSITFDANGDCLFKDLHFDVQIEASDLAQVPDSRSLSALEDFLDRRELGDLADADLPILEFPGSGAILPPTWSQTEVDGLMATCAWIHRQATGLPRPAKKRRDSKLSLTPDLDPDGDSFMISASSPATDANVGRKILIHCADGYTESSLLALAYTMYAEALPAHAAWLSLHRERKRNFFAYSSDVALLRAIQPRILQASPRYAAAPALSLMQLAPPEPEWLDRMDGSLPSRVMPHMYLGNLGHANNPALLKELGIGRVLSVGEPVGWPAGGEGEAAWRGEDLMFVEGVQDNGVDPLVEDFGRCLEFIGKFHKPSPYYLFFAIKSLTFVISLVCRTRPRSQHSNPRPLPRRRLPLRHHLHRRCHGHAGPVVPARVLLCARAEAECYYTAAFAVLVRLHLPIRVFGLLSNFGGIVTNFSNGKNCKRKSAEDR